MQTFGWSVEYVLSLTHPQFMYLTGIVQRLRADDAADGFFVAYCAGKYGNTCAKRMEALAGDWFAKDGDEAKDYTPEMLAAARERMRRHLESIGVEYKPSGLLEELRFGEKKDGDCD